MLTIQKIINDADTAVPNEYSVSDKVSWLNNVNQDFFNVVKIPTTYRFNTSMESTFVLPSDVRQKNIDLVMVGLLKYRDLNENNVFPLQNVYDFNDMTRQLTLTPAPYLGGLTTTVRYHRIATTTFTTSNLNAIPDAPEEYHWTYVIALCSYIADAMDDVQKAANYENRYKAAWNVAAANYTAGDES